MFGQLPYKKMRKIGTFGFVAQCDCGHTHKFKGTDFDLSKSNASSAEFNELYTCPNCKTVYNGIFENIEDRNVWYRRTSPLGLLVSAIMILGLLFGGIKLLSTITIFDTEPVNSDINKATNKELEQFYKWDQKQKQKEWENQPAFNNGN
ncbi:hypothetical protein [Neobacillus vireti]|uniref:hypothetical protein n=1 Tax=Neobacillus vireti TaxID=220686 RepID=UPI00040C1897|nr:hypothetical protein [Neobacillus vireti]